MMKIKIIITELICLVEAISTDATVQKTNKHIYSMEENFLNFLEPYVTGGENFVDKVIANIRIDHAPKNTLALVNIILQNPEYVLRTLCEQLTLDDLTDIGKNISASVFALAFNVPLRNYYQRMKFLHAVRAVTILDNHNISAAIDVCDMATDMIIQGINSTIRKCFSLWITQKIGLKHLDDINFINIPLDYCISNFVNSFINKGAEVIKYLPGFMNTVASGINSFTGNNIQNIDNFVQGMRETDQFIQNMESQFNQKFGTRNQKEYRILHSVAKKRGKNGTLPPSTDDQQRLFLDLSHHLLYEPDNQDLNTTQASRLTTAIAKLGVTIITATFVWKTIKNSFLQKNEKH